jgi:hypothetical protein
MDRACRTHGVNKYVQDVCWSVSQKGRDLQEDNIQMNLTEIGYTGVDRVQRAQDRDQRPTFVNTAPNIRLP